MFDISNNKPSVEAFINMRTAAKWETPHRSTVELSVKNSLYWVCVRQNDELVGLGRVVGDGAMYFYIQDVIVAPSFQRKGIGNMIMANIECFLAANCAKHATIGLFSAKGKEAFYRKYQYMVRDGSNLGFGMCKFV